MTAQANEYKFIEQFLKVVMPIITFILGYFVSRFSMTKKEKKDHQARLQESSNKLAELCDQRYQEFALALNNYINKEETPDLNDFFNIATKGDGYLNQAKTLCDSILSGNIDKTSIKNTHLPMIKDIVEKVLPSFYETLQDIAKKKHIRYDGKLKRENYMSIYGVYENYKLGKLS